MCAGHHFFTPDNCILYVDAPHKSAIYLRFFSCFQIEMVILFSLLLLLNQSCERVAISIAFEVL